MRIHVQIHTRRNENNTDVDREGEQVYEKGYP